MMGCGIGRRRRLAQRVRASVFLGAQPLRVPTSPSHSPSYPPRRHYRNVRLNKETQKYEGRTGRAHNNVPASQAISWLESWLWFEPVMSDAQKLGRSEPSDYSNFCISEYLTSRFRV